MTPRSCEQQSTRVSRGRRQKGQRACSTYILLLCLRLNDDEHRRLDDRLEHGQSIGNPVPPDQVVTLLDLALGGLESVGDGWENLTRRVGVRVASDVQLDGVERRVTRNIDV